MKNSFSYHSARGNKSGRNKLLAATCIVIAIYTLDLLTQGAIRKQVHAGTAAVSRWAAGAAEVVVGSGLLSSRRSLESQNRSLLQQLAQAEERVFSHGALKAENDILRALVHMVGSATSASMAGGVTAPIVSSVRSSPYGTFLIGAGSEDGITSGSIVLTSEGYVIGVVGTVGAHTAVVSEIFAPGATIDAVLNGASVVVRGSGGGNAHVKVPRQMAVEIGDPVVAPQFGQRAVGLVGEVASSSASASQDVYIRLPTSLSSLRYVYVVAESY